MRVPHTEQKKFVIVLPEAMVSFREYWLSLSSPVISMSATMLSMTSGKRVEERTRQVLQRLIGHVEVAGEH